MLTTSLNASHKHKRYCMVCYEKICMKTTSFFIAWPLKIWKMSAFWNVWLYPELTVLAFLNACNIIYFLKFRTISGTEFTIMAFWNACNIIYYDFFRILYFKNDMFCRVTVVIVWENDILFIWIKSRLSLNLDFFSQIDMNYNGLTTYFKVSNQWLVLSRGLGCPVA